MGSITGLRFEDPRQGDLTRADLDDPSRSYPAPSLIAPARRPQADTRNEADALLLAIFKHGFGATVREVVHVLHRRDLEDFRRRLDLLDRDFAQSRETNHAFVEQLFDRAELFLTRHLRIDPMQLPQIDAFHARAASGWHAPV